MIKYRSVKEVSAAYVYYPTMPRQLHTSIDVVKQRIIDANTSVVENAKVVSFIVEHAEVVESKETPVITEE